MAAIFKIVQYRNSNMFSHPNIDHSIIQVSDKEVPAQRKKVYQSRNLPVKFVLTCVFDQAIILVWGSKVCNNLELTSSSQNYLVVDLSVL